MARLQEVAHEAICSALYSMPFTRFLGERPDPVDGGEVAWFRLSRDPSVEKVNVREDPKIVVVSVSQEPAEIVRVRAEWLNVSAGFDQRLRGSFNFRIPTSARDEAVIRKACEEVVVRVLEVFKEVLAGTGVAGPIDALAPESAYEETEDDLARTDEEVGRE